jgi:predicted nucleic acid-binding protein
MYLLDTDVLIDVERGHLAAVAWFYGLPNNPSVPDFAVMELIEGANNAQHLSAALALVSSLPVVWPTDADCNRALADFTKYHLSHNLGFVDALIAACAVGLSATLCSFNVKHFQVVPGLVMMQPYSR